MGLTRPSFASRIALAASVAATLTSPAWGASPSLVKDINTKAERPAESRPRQLGILGSVATFVADDATAHELWRTDGTDAGTLRIADLCAGNCSLAVGPRLYFAASSDEHGIELWALPLN